MRLLFLAHRRVRVVLQGEIIEDHPEDAPAFHYVGRLGREAQ